jgi:hypothetical protein
MKGRTEESPASQPQSISLFSVWPLNTAGKTHNRSSSWKKVSEFSRRKKHTKITQVELRGWFQMYYGLNCVSKRRGLNSKPWCLFTWSYLEIESLQLSSSYDEATMDTGEL